MVWIFLKNLGIKLPYDPAIPLLGIYPEETKIEKKITEENSTELQKPNVEAEAYDNNKKCDWGKKSSQA